MSPGLVNDNDAFNSTFRAGEPYSLAFVSGSEFRIYDAAGADVTSEVPGGGVIDPLANGGNVIGDELVPTDLTDFSSQMIKIRQARPDLIATNLGGNRIEWQEAVPSPA